MSETMRTAVRLIWGGLWRLLAIIIALVVVWMLDRHLATFSTERQIMTYLMIGVLGVYCHIYLVRRQMEEIHQKLEMRLDKIEYQLHGIVREIIRR